MKQAIKCRNHGGGCDGWKWKGRTNWYYCPISRGTTVKVPSYQTCPACSKKRREVIDKVVYWCKMKGCLCIRFEDGPWITNPHIHYMAQHGRVKGIKVYCNSHSSGGSDAAS